MTTDPNARRSRDAAADATTADETVTEAATPAVAPRTTPDLTGLDVFSTGDPPEADATDDDEPLDATRRRAAMLLDADVAVHLASDISATARELPIVQAQPAEEPADAIAHGGFGDRQADDEDDDDEYAEDDDDEYAEDDDDEYAEDDGDETVIAPVTSRPRTLSAAFRQGREEIPAPEEDSPPRDATLPPFPVPLPLATEPAPEDASAEDEIEDDLDPEEEWAVADQPTIYLPPQRRTGMQGPAAEREGSPYRPPVQSWPGQGQAPGQPPTGPRPGIVRPGPAVPIRRFAPIPTPRSGYVGPRLSSPKGRPMPGTPPDGVPPAAMADPRMERFRELRGSREAHDQGERAADEARPVSAIVRQWWGDLLPGLRGALRHQHEAQASGVHPVSPYEAAPASKLGDAFGRLTQSARDLTDRARPALQRIHDQAEHAAQAIVGRFDQPTAVQQAPFLGPGRVAIFFKTGVTVGQAHALLMRRQARPMRLIPRKHGFLAAVAPGREAEVCDGLRNHPYVRDVAYIAYDDAGKPIDRHEA